MSLQANISEERRSEGAKELGALGKYPPSRNCCFISESGLVVIELSINGRSFLRPAAEHAAIHPLKMEKIEEEIGAFQL